MIWHLLMRLTGGRPMARQQFRFMSIDGGFVYYYKDQFGRTWLAQGPWSLIRTPAAWELPTSLTQRMAACKPNE